MSATDHDHERIIHVDDQTYEQAVDEGLVMLDFWAEWCGPCKALAPVIEELVETHAELTVAKIDVDANEATMDEFGIQSIPTMILFKDGEAVEVFAGKVAYPELDRAVREHA